jgi:hypothetical protein
MALLGRTLFHVYCTVQPYSGQCDARLAARATPQAVAALLAAGWEAARLRYYRGGVHDWVTLGLPLTR